MATSSRSVIGDLSRRGFIKSTAAAAGGLVVACYLPGCSKPEQVAKHSGPPKMVKANAWLQIGTDGSITMFCDKSEMGQGVYTALPTLLAEELGVEPTTIKVEFAPPGNEYVNKLLGAQATGGSTSVREAWDKIRMAGAEARTRLIAAAAKEWGAPPQSCTVADGYVLFTSRRASFGELAEAAAAMPAPQNVQVKGHNEFKYVGKVLPRLDTPSKVDGSAQYGIDMRLPGMLYAALAQPPELGASVKSFNADKAKTMPGVREVLQTSSGVAVVADTWWQAKTARDALDIQWAPGAAAKLTNASIYAGLKTASSGKGLDVRKEGDVDAGWKENTRRVEATYELPLLAHATLEPQNCTVEFRDDGCHVYAPTQVQQMSQSAAMKASGLPAEKVFVHTTFLGGGFGRRLDVDFVPAAVECAKAMNKPVKLLWTREDDTTHDKYRPPARNTLSGAFDGNGKLNTVKIHLVAPSITSRWAPGAVPQGTPDPFAVEAAHNFPYDVPNLHIDYLQHEVGLEVGYWRSVSHALNCFTVESFMDELAAEAQMDPVEFRRSLLGKQPRWLSVLDAAAHKANWGQPPAGRYQGVALMSGYDTYLAQVAEISLDGDKLKVHRIVCAIDCGQMVNPGIVQAQAEGGIIFGLTAALFSEINVVNGKVQETNFDKYRLLRINEAPSIEIHLLNSDEKPGGMGEPTVALVAPAVCNAIYAATKKRLRKLPIAKQGFTI
ncbi:molybdopterin cofactor-binding domain-containing protein [Steroidobacter flavus]|uniref:Molybdopterin cofactor-binding domain-containing protein n=1 Tax=Steroidobacter flavus TaxID=1842136 RepID=A0ABV8SQU5_9GAMM